MLYMRGGITKEKEMLDFYKTFKDTAYSAKVVGRGKKYSQVSKRSRTIPTLLCQIYPKKHSWTSTVRGQKWQEEE